MQGVKNINHRKPCDKTVSKASKIKQHGKA